MGYQAGGHPKRGLGPLAIQRLADAQRHFDSGWTPAPLVGGGLPSMGPTSAASTRPGGEQGQSPSDLLRRDKNEWRQASGEAGGGLTRGPARVRSV